MAKSKAELQKSRMNLKAMVEVKGAMEGDRISSKDLEKINQYTRKELTSEQVYIYPIILTSNDEDRENEYFDKKDLNKLSKLFIGKTGIFDHAWKSGNQHSRVYKCKVEVVEGETNFKGDQLYVLKAWAYTIKQGNEDLIAKIDAGIYKEVSIGFSTDDLECSICGNSFFDYSNCKHWPGVEYTNNGVTDICRLRMKDPTDAYEFSFVSVPCNTDAETTKGVKLEKDERVKEKVKNQKHEKNSDDNTPSIFYAKISKRSEKGMEFLKKMVEKAKGENATEINIPIADIEKDLEIYKEAIQKAEDAEKEKNAAEDKVKDLEPKAKMGDQYIDDVKKECIRLGKMAEGEAFNEQVMEKVFDKCDIEELKGFKSQYEKKIDEKYPPTPQIKSREEDTDENKTIVKEADNSSFKM
ncbi:XkdF-like putative serine protease domain-containing protein [Tepidibacter hydrothermalis]|uniref:XkdF-like putative serine protease domain-containing protein n=1 Tax=Tepidibacter hydrothermalis TaxID=3036126 RepID=A0ABY8ELL4_9FIRM|nr:XkdF-like putative serine protease domain-containing protein [Tepidibacter hydrothermalis]WFD12420.1 XkdF-like putative serine protease domain-containing protein [Tepidibacter hydrothermalis]